MESPGISGLANTDTLGSKKKTLLARWKDEGFGGPFTEIAVRSVRVGSYKCVPVDRVVLSSEGISLIIPIMEKDGQPSETKTANVAIPTSNMLDVQAHFSRTLSVLFFRTVPFVSRNVSSLLGLIKGPDLPFWDLLSKEESQKRLTLFLHHNLVENSRQAIQSAFSSCGIYKEINAVTANNILVKSSPLERHNLSAHIAVTPAECNAPSSSSCSYGSTANKLNGVEVIEIQPYGSSKTAVLPVPCWSFERISNIPQRHVPSHVPRQVELIDISDDI